MRHCDFTCVPKDSCSVTMPCSLSVFAACLWSIFGAIKGTLMPYGGCWCRCRASSRGGEGVTSLDRSIPIKGFVPFWYCPASGLEFNLQWCNHTANVSLFVLNLIYRRFDFYTSLPLANEAWGMRPEQHAQELPGRLHNENLTWDKWFTMLDLE